MAGGTASHQGGAAGGGVKQPDCVLWHPPGNDPPPRLAATLERRGVSILRCQSPMLAMAHACRLARRRRQRTDNLPGEDGVILLLVEPVQLDMAADVVEAVEATVGSVACWRYQEDDDAPLRAVTPEDIADWRGDEEDEDEPLRPVVLGIPAAAVAPRRHTEPSLRLVGDDADHVSRHELDGSSDEEPVEMPEEPDPGTLLTEEELMMLLSSDPAEWETETEPEET